MKKAGGTGLPLSIEAAWGLAGGPRKGPKPGLALERIVVAGVRVAEAEGLGAISMNRVASELGVSTMSLYRYVGSKDELTELMVDAAYGTPMDQPRPGENWRGALSRWAWAQHHVLRGHPWVLRIPQSAPPTTPNQVAWLEAGLACLQETNLNEHEKLWAILLIGSYLRGEAALVAEINVGFRTSGITSPQAIASYGRLLTTLVAEQRFPALLSLVRAGVFEQEQEPSTEFRFGLERVLDGLEAFISR